MTLFVLFRAHLQHHLNMRDTTAVRDVLLKQFDIAWSLMAYHLDELTTQECLWKPAARCLHVVERKPGSWHAQWPEHERYDIGPPTIAWTTWHICYWWSKTLEHVEGRSATVSPDLEWAGSANGVRLRIDELRQKWRAILENSSETQWEESRPDGWPLPNSDLQTIAAWLNVELMKNAAELGMIRFLYAVRENAGGL